MAEQTSPTRCYWELTRRCRSQCIFCRGRPTEPAATGSELTLTQSLRVAEELVQCGVKRVVLTGGEPILYDGWEQIAAALTKRGANVWLFTSGVGFEPTHYRAAMDAGVSRFLIPIDGDRHTHNLLRPAGGIPTSGSENRDAYDLSLKTLELLQSHGANVSVVTQVSHVNAGALDQVYELLLEHAVRRWQVHLCQLTGHAGLHRQELLQEPVDVERIVEVLLRAAREGQVIAPLHCTIGYMTAEEPVLRGRIGRGRPVFDGCPAGLRTFGITPSGGVKGCTALPDAFVTASLTTRSVRDILADDDCFPYTRIPRSKILEAHCAACVMGNICRAGCPAVSYGLTGSIGANPLCLKHIRRISG